MKFFIKDLVEDFSKLVRYALPSLVLIKVGHSFTITYLSLYKIYGVNRFTFTFIEIPRLFGNNSFAKHKLSS